MVPPRASPALQRAGADGHKAPQGPPSRQRGRHKMLHKPLETGQRSRFPLGIIRPRAIFLGFVSAVAGRRLAESSRIAGSEGR